MPIVLGDNQYGKAETHVVRITKSGSDGKAHEIKDLNVSISLIGDFAASHMSGDNSKIVPTDTQKNTVFAFAREPAVGEIEDFAVRLAHHFVVEFASVYRARVSIEEYPWSRITVDGKPHPHAFVRAGSEKRLATVTCTDDGTWVVSGISDLVVLKSTGSEFSGYPKDRFTTLEETRDRVLATSVVARWRHASVQADWAQSFAETRRVLLETFAVKHSLAIQQSLYAMGEAVLNTQPGVAEIRLSMPNKHHFSVDLSPFGLSNDNEVFYASDRPYGLIEGTVTRDDAPEAGFAW
ncbi:MAG TPA: urate oxidase [Candidatus Dormibacteraeota bacterium]|nr:urate oxidase [Candidatus Dormibacteraeota bacterium]